MVSKNMLGYISGSSMIRAMFEEGKRLSEIHGEENVFDFSLGSPNVEPPDEIKENIINILNEEKPNMIHGYMNNSGYIDVRKQIAEHLSKLHDVRLNEENIVMTCGAAGGLNVLFKTLLDEEDEVITFAPYFVEYRNFVKNYHGNLIVVQADMNTFLPDMNAFKAAITKKTKAVIINSPNNPTGVIYSEEIIQQLAKIIEDKQAEFGRSIYLISDEPYRELNYDGAHIPYTLKYFKNTFVCYSYSKSLSLPGERIGYIVSNGEMDDFENIRQGLNVANRILGFVNAPSLFQRVIARSLDSEVDISVYKKNRDMLYNHLVELGFSCVKPDGAFYLFPKSLIEDDVQFAEDAKKFNLLIVPGKAFDAPGHFRISYCIDPVKVEKSLDAFTKLADLYK